MTDKKGTIKSAFDLAMERLSQKGEEMVSLTPEQKEKIAEVGRRAKAKIAEIEIMYRKRIEEARTKSDGDEKIALIEKERQGEIDRIKSREEDERKKLRQGQ